MLASQTCPQNVALVVTVLLAEKIWLLPVQYYAGAVLQFHPDSCSTTGSRTKDSRLKQECKPCLDQPVRQSFLGS